LVGGSSPPGPTTHFQEAFRISSLSATLSNPTSRLDNDLLPACSRIQSKSHSVEKPAAPHHPASAGRPDERPHGRTPRARRLTSGFKPDRCSRSTTVTGSGRTEASSHASHRAAVAKSHMQSRLSRASQSRKPLRKAQGLAAMTAAPYTFFSAICIAATVIFWL
jgi:hypothetical protein